MIVTLSEMKLYLRLEPTDTEEEMMIESFMLAAETYIRGATGFKLQTNVPETAKLIVKLLTSHWYENRAVETTIYPHKIGFTVEMLLAQLKYSHTEDGESA